MTETQIEEIDALKQKILDLEHALAQAHYKRAKYASAEERVKAQKEYQKQYREAHKKSTASVYHKYATPEEKIQAQKEQQRLYREMHRKPGSRRNKHYNSAEERIAAQREQQKQWYLAHNRGVKPEAQSSEG
jgi:hypothetical protein